MRLVTFERGGQSGFGALEGDKVVDLTSLFESALQFLELGPVGVEAARGAVKYRRSSGEGVFSLGDVKLKAPVRNPRKLLCLAGNYPEHIP